MEIVIPVSAGELLDKISVLEIKKTRIDDSSKLIYIDDEYDQLNKIAVQLDLYNIVGAKAFDSLRMANLTLWDVINEMMVMENAEIFNDRYYELAKKVRSLNDDRYDCKSAIDRIANSDVKEQKGYTNVEIND